MRRFIQAGDEYLKTLDEAAKYPAKGEACLYCRQPLSPEPLPFSRSTEITATTICAPSWTGRADIDTIRRTFQQGVDFADVEAVSAK